jgi:putative SOS response-associated peptidase YedK
MCGRFGATFQYRDIKTRWNLYGDLSGFAPRYNIAPSQEVLINARSESLVEAGNSCRTSFYGNANVNLANTVLAG